MGRRVGIPLARIGTRPATRGRVNSVATPSAAASPSQPRARSMAGIERLKRWRRPSRCRRSSPARSSSFTWRETAGSDTRWSVASSLMVRVRWASRRSTSRRRGLARAEKTRSSEGLRVLTIMLIVGQGGYSRQPASQRRGQPQSSGGAGGRSRARCSLRRWTRARAQRSRHEAGRSRDVGEARLALAEALDAAAGRGKDPLAGYATVDSHVDHGFPEQKMRITFLLENRHHLKQVFEALERQGDSCRRAAPVAVLAEDALAGPVEEVET